MTFFIGVGPGTFVVYEAPLTIVQPCRRSPQYVPAPCKLTFDLLILNVVSESHVTWATSVPILVFLGLSVLDLGPIRDTQYNGTKLLNSLLTSGLEHDRGATRRQISDTKRAISKQ